MKPDLVIIKKYENRRLYDTSASRYVNLDEVAAMVRNGTEVQVVDAKTRQDLTRATLTQIIVEESKDQPAGLPLEVLRQLIMASDKVRQEFMSWYLKSAFDSYQKMQSAFTSGLAQVGSVALAPLDSFRSLFQGVVAKPDSDGRELTELRERVAELEAQLRRKKRPVKRRSAVKN